MMFFVKVAATSIALYVFVAMTGIIFATTVLRKQDSVSF